MLGRARHRVELLIPYRAAGVIDALKREALVLGMEYTDDGVAVEAVVPPELLGRVKAYIPGYTETGEDWEK